MKKPEPTPRQRKPKRPKPLVIISVSGGVAEVAGCPRGIVVEIVDFDNLSQTPNDEFNRDCYSPRVQKFIKECDTPLWERLYALPTPDCTHAAGEDCMICDECGKCSEPLDETEVCQDCRQRTEEAAKKAAMQLLGACMAIRDNWEHGNLSDVMQGVNAAILAAQPPKKEGSNAGSSE